MTPENTVEKTSVPKLALSVEETAEAIGVSLTGCYGLVRRADFPSIRLGGRWIIPVDALRNWMNDRVKEKALCASTDQSDAQRA